MRRLLAMLILLASSVALAGDAITLSAELPVAVVEVYREKDQPFLSEQISLDYGSGSVYISLAVITPKGGYRHGGVELSIGEEGYDVATWRTPSCRSFAIGADGTAIVNQRGNATGSSTVLVATYDRDTISEDGQIGSGESKVFSVSGKAELAVILTGERKEASEYFLLATYIPSQQDGDGIVNLFEDFAGRTFAGVSISIDNDAVSELTVGTLSTLCQAVKLEDTTGIAVNNKDDNQALLGLAIIELP